MSKSTKILKLFNDILEKDGETSEVRLTFSEEISRESISNIDRLDFIYTYVRNMIDREKEELETSSFSIGDVVKHKAGGPNMVVETTWPENGVIKHDCSWFDGNGQCHKRCFNASSLRELVKL